MYGIAPRRGRITGIDSWGESPSNRPAKDKKAIEDSENVLRDEGNQEKMVNGMLGTESLKMWGEVKCCRSV